MKKLVIGSNRVEFFWASSLDQVKKKEAHGNNLVQELIINVKFNKVVYHDFTSNTRFNKRYIIVTLQVQEVQLQVVAIDLYMDNFMWFRPFLWSLMTKGERNEQRYEFLG